MQKMNIRKRHHDSQATVSCGLAVKLATERLSDLEEQLAHVTHTTAADPEASKERASLLDEIAAQRRLIAELQGA
jgi:hypothetical protein